MYRALSKDIRGRGIRTAAVAGVALGIVLCSFRWTLGAGEPPGRSGQRIGLTERKTVTILITDSGLGGLSVAAAIERRLQQCHFAEQVDLVFANALPDNEHPYNRMADSETKAAAFSSALDGFVSRYRPDLILIACNTLSVVYPATRFAANPPVPVFGIVGFGVDMIADFLAADSSADVIVMGTPTTADSDAHRKALEAQGVDGRRITVQGCDQLESEIQADPTSDIVQAMIGMYAEQAISTRDSQNHGAPVIALCCTHYRYAREMMAAAFAAALGTDVAVLDPNGAMADAVFDGVDCGRYPTTTIHVKVVSRADISPNDVLAVSRLLAEESPATAAALRAYEYDTTLFVFRP